MQNPLVGKVLADRFEILQRIGEGGTGIVYKAKQLTIGRHVAVKLLSAEVASDPSWVKRFNGEARAAARLSNPHTIQIIDSGQTPEGLFYIAMELLSGRPLSDEIARVGRMSPQRALHILSQMCESLTEAHTEGIIHRDIKPDNVFLLEDKRGGDFVKVIDFSIAKVEGDTENTSTRFGVIFGTPSYMSPEQCRGEKLLPQSDIYACGIVAYEMLAGRPPFQSRMPVEVIMMHQRQAPPPLPDVPEPVWALVMQMLEKSAARRPATMVELEDACQRCLGLLGGAPARQMTGALQALSAPLPASSMSAPPPLAPRAGTADSAGRTVALDMGAPPPVSQAPRGGRTLALDAGGAVQAPQAEPPAEPPAGRPSGRAWLAPVVAFLAMAVIGGGGYLVWSRSHKKVASPGIIAPRPKAPRPPPPPEKDEEQWPEEKGVTEKPQPAAAKAPPKAKGKVATAVVKPKAAPKAKVKAAPKSKKPKGKKPGALQLPAVF